MQCHAHNHKSQPMFENRDLDRLLIGRIAAIAGKNVKDYSLFIIFLEQS